MDWSRNLRFTKLSNYDGFPHHSVGKSSACNAGDPGLIPGSERSPGERNGNPLQYSCQENPMEREAWQAIVHGVTKSRTRQHTTAAADVSVWVQPQ